MIKIQQKIRLLALICLIGPFSPTIVKADIKEVAYSCLNQVLQNKVISGCFATVFALFVLYKYHVKNKTIEDKKLLPSQILEVKKLLELEQTSHASSIGNMGEKLHKRCESMKKVFCAISNNPYWLSIIIHKEKLQTLMTHPLIAQALVEEQEISLIDELSKAHNMYKEKLYQKHAQKMYSPDQQKLSSNLNPEQHLPVAFKTFYDYYGFEKQLNIWQQNSTYFKEPLQQLITEHNQK